MSGKNDSQSELIPNEFSLGLDGATTLYHNDQTRAFLIYSGMQNPSTICFTIRTVALYKDGNRPLYVPVTQSQFTAGGRTFDIVSVSPSQITLRYYTKKREGCFVATAVYGNPDSPEVQALRELRDNVLMSSILGRVVVDFYYSGFGEGVANFLEAHPSGIIPRIRRFLDYVVKNYDSKRGETDSF